MRWELLERFLTDACDEAERAEVERWAAESSRHRQILAELASVFGADQDAPSVRSEWERLRRELQIEAEPDDPAGPDVP